jgi:hypothetical protein
LLSQKFGIAPGYQRVNSEALRPSAHHVQCAGPD